MTSTIKQAQFSNLPLPEDDVDGRRVFLHQFLPASCTYEAASCPCTYSLSSCQGVSPCASDQLRTARDHHQQQEERDGHLQPTDIHHCGGLIINTSMATAEDSESEIAKHNAAENSDPASSSGQGKWASPKMRFVRRMAADQVDAASRPRKSRAALHDRQQAADGGNHGGGATVRVCSDCNTTKTPLWRSGPRGPKSLCNACGIRQRKARRAMAAAALTGGGVSIPSVARGKLQIEKKKHGVVPFKKRCKFAAAAAAEAGEKKIQTDDLAISCGKNSGIHRVFPQEEKEAAILLMSLSCRLIRG